jgi:peptide/nickel transport system ATP-binding protein
MYQGAVIEQGMKSEIMSPPHPEYTQLLLNSVPEMDPDWLTKLVKSR